jgi:flavin-dependent dehydrogenase
MEQTDFARAGDRPQTRYDVVILGGGLAGLTLGRQLKRVRPETSVLVVEQRQGPARDAAFEIGESTVEISAHYFSEVIGMKEHLEREQLRKSGHRFFFSADGNRDIAARYEWGPSDFPLKDSHQLDRGRFEDALWKANLESGVDVFGASRAEDVDLGDEEHIVTVSRGDSTTAVKGRWVVDATGQSSMLKRKLGLAQDVEHTINAAWLRLSGGIDVDDWSNDPDWHARVAGRGVRVASTNHLIGEGYWVGMIPLVSGPISVEIAADPRFHPWGRIETLDAAIDWLREHEPQLASAIDGRRDQIEDFLAVQDFAYGCERVYSPERWCLTGAAATFTDPLYSPGSDFIAFGNTFITDLVTRDLNGEDIAGRLEFYNRDFQSLFAAYLRMYTDQYPGFGNQQVMGLKLLWDFTGYWSINALRFVTGKLTDMRFTQAVQTDLVTIFQLTLRMQELFKQWRPLAMPEQGPGFVSTNNIRVVHDKQTRLAAPVADDEELVALFADNARFLQAVAVLIFHQALQSLPDSRIDEDQNINPLVVGLDPDRWEEDGLFDDSGMSLSRARELAPGLEDRWRDQAVASRLKPLTKRSTGCRDALCGAMRRPRSRQ